MRGSRRECDGSVSIWWGRRIAADGEHACVPPLAIHNLLESEQAVVRKRACGQRRPTPETLVTRRSSRAGSFQRVERMVHFLIYASCTLRMAQNFRGRLGRRFVLEGSHAEGGQGQAGLLPLLLQGRRRVPRPRPQAPGVQHDQGLVYWVIIEPEKDKKDRRTRPPPSIGWQL